MNIHKEHTERIGYEETLADFVPTSLEELDKLNLLNRFDTKFVVPETNLAAILRNFAADYKILEIGGKRAFHYQSNYLDTNDYFFYNQHHNGKLLRSKIRFRTYLDSGYSFLEIKRKGHHSQTFKDRMVSAFANEHFSDDEADFVESALHIEPELLGRKLTVFYRRITLINAALQEKVTIDTDIIFENGTLQKPISSVAIIEIKQRKVNVHSPAFRIAKPFHIGGNSGISKYCLGLIITGANVRYNRFKPNILAINKFLRP